MSTFTAFYDLEYGPVSYDFVTWLVRAKLEAAGAPLHVVIVPKEDGVGGFARDWGGHDEASARWRLWHILVASCPLARATVTVAASRAQAALLRSGACWWPEGKAHFMGPLVQAARRGQEIPRLMATDGARRYVRTHLGEHVGKLITLTLRNHAGDRERNSDAETWNRFAAFLIARGNRVVVLDDANDALNAGRGYYELDPDLRLALYQEAALNISANTGTQELLKFSPAPYLAMNQALTDGWRDHFRKYFNMEPGEQLPWATTEQRLVYRAATLSVLQEEYSRWAGATS